MEKGYKSSFTQSGLAIELCFGFQYFVIQIVHLAIKTWFDSWSYLTFPKLRQSG